MYKWPQGRVIRTIFMILALVVALDLAYTGGIAKFLALQEGGEGYMRQMVLGVFFTTVGAAALIAGIVAAGFHKRAVDFLIEVEGEMVKVEWPKTNTLIRATLIIAVVVAVLAGVILLVDGIVYWFINLLIDLKRFF